MSSRPWQRLLVHGMFYARTPDLPRRPSTTRCIEHTAQGTGGDRTTARWSPTGPQSAADDNGAVVPSPPVARTRVTHPRAATAGHGKHVSPEIAKERQQCGSQDSRGVHGHEVTGTANHGELRPGDGGRQLVALGHGNPRVFRTPAHRD